MPQTRKGLAPVVWIIIAAILLGGGYVVYKTLDYSFSTDNPPNPIRAEDIKKETKLTDDISDWKPYRNEKYGFEFDYPSHLTPFSAIKNDKLIPADSSAGRVVVAENEKKVICCEPFTLTFEIGEAADGMYLQNLDKKTSFNTYDAVILYGEGNLGSVYKQIAVTPDGRSIMLITLNAKSELLERILSTFKFTK